MSTAAINTKIERVVEATEALAIAAASAVRRPEGHSSYNDVRDARQEMADALREFMQPMLRVVG